MDSQPPESQTSASAPRAPFGLSKWINLTLGAYIVWECVQGILGADEAYDMVWWLLVTPILLVNVLRRGPALEVDYRWFVWIICTASTLHFLAFEGDDSRWWAEVLLVAIILIGDLNLIYLGRSFSILPARREIRQGLAYRLVRHPIYATYLCSDAIFVILVPTPRNFLVFGVAIALWVIRSELEETLLRKDPVYREYATRTRWRFLPLVF